MKVRSTVKRAEEQVRVELIGTGINYDASLTSKIESRIGYAVEQSLKWTHTHRRTESPAEIARIQARYLAEEIREAFRNGRA
jgi:hypothetical protein